MSRLTIDDLRELCDRFVPDVVRHPSAPVRGDRTLEQWWYSHELGHLLTSEPSLRSVPMFGLDEGTRFGETELQCRELAAMSISRRLLMAAGRADLWREEVSGTDSATLLHAHRGRPTRILKKFGCLRIPRTRAELERFILSRIG